MGQEQKKFHITDNGDIYKINEDGSFTSIGNASQVDTKITAENNTRVHKPSNQKGWLMTNYNWLFLISLILLIISGMTCTTMECYGDSAMLGMLSMCAGATAIILPWIFKSITKIWVVLLFLLLATALITIIAFSEEWLYTIQIAFAFVSLLAFGIAYAKNIKTYNK